MSTEGEDLLEQIALDNIIQVQREENTLRNNFDVVAQILRLGLKHNRDQLKQLEEQKADQELQKAVLQDQKAEIDQQKNSVHDLNEKQDLADKKLNNVAQEIIDGKEEIKRCTDSLDNLEKNQNDFKSRIEQLEDKDKKRDEELAQLRDADDQAKQQIKDLKDQMEQIQSALDNIQESGGDRGPLPLQADKISRHPSKVPGNTIVITFRPTGGRSRRRSIVDNTDYQDADYVKWGDFDAACEAYDNDIARLNDELDKMRKNQKRSDQRQAHHNVPTNRPQNADQTIADHETEGNADHPISDWDQAATGQQNFDPQDLEDRIRNLEEEVEDLRRQIQPAGKSAGKEGKVSEQSTKDKQGRQDDQDYQDHQDRHADEYDHLPEHESTLPDQTGQERTKSDKGGVELGSHESSKQSMKDFATKSDIADLQAKIRDLYKLIDQANGKVQNLASSVTQQQQESPQELRDWVDELVKTKISELNDELSRQITDLQGEIAKRPTFDDLWKTEALLLEKMDEVTGALLKKLADRQDMKKALVYLEKKINQLYGMINEALGGGAGGPEALGVKRPMIWSCISCDKVISRYEGRLGDYKGWAVFPPKETSPERMGRFGRGAKILLENQKAKAAAFQRASEEMARSQNNNGDQTLEEERSTLPDINKKDLN